jgi:hypothetical protein
MRSTSNLKGDALALTEKRGADKRRHRIHYIRHLILPTLLPQRPDNGHYFPS